MSNKTLSIKKDVDAFFDVYIDDQEIPEELSTEDIFGKNTERSEAEIAITDALKKTWLNELKDTKKYRTENRQKAYREFVNNLEKHISFDVIRYFVDNSVSFMWIEINALIQVLDVNSIHIDDLDKVVKMMTFQNNNKTAKRNKDEDDYDLSEMFSFESALCKAFLSVFVVIAGYGMKIVLTGEFTEIDELFASIIPIGVFLGWLLIGAFLKLKDNKDKPVEQKPKRNQPEPIYYCDVIKDVAYAKALLQSEWLPVVEKYNEDQKIPDLSKSNSIIRCDDYLNFVKDLDKYMAFNAMQYCINNRVSMEWLTRNILNKCEYPETVFVELDDIENANTKAKQKLPK